VTGAAAVPAPAATQMPRFGHVLAGAGLNGPAAYLAGLLEREFLAEAGWDPVIGVLTPPAEHPLLGSAVCAVSGCGRKVEREGRRCRPCSRPAACLTADTPEQPPARVPGPGMCWVPGCGRACGSAATRLCQSHRSHRQLLGLTLAEFISDPRARPLPAGGPCAVTACTRQRTSRRCAYCNGHYTRLLRLRQAGTGTDEELWQRTEDGIDEAGVLNLRGLPALVVTEILFALQQRTRHGSKTRMDMLASICDQLRRGQARTLGDLPLPGSAGPRRTLARELIRYCRRALLDPETEKAKDIWDLAAFGHRGRLAFTGISQPWLRQAAKGWAADDLPRHRGKSAGAAVQSRLNAVARLSESLRCGRDDHGSDPARLGRGDIDRFLHRTAYLTGTGQLSDYMRVETCWMTRAVLTRIRALGLTRAAAPAAGLPEDFAITRADIPAASEPGEPGRDMPPEILRQLCGSLRALEDLANPEVRVAVELAMDTGRRPEEICALPWDCLTPGGDGAALLVYDNLKAGRLRRSLPISTATAELITGQKQRVRQRYPASPPADLVLLPSRWANPHGHRSISVAHLSDRHRAWINALPPLLRADGTEFDKARIVPYSYRHCYAQRHADAGVPVDVLRDLMDHRTFDVTRRYYRVGEERRREAVDLVTAMCFDRHGNRIWRDARMLLDAARTRYAIGEVAVPYGTCAEPSNVQAGGGACPVRFRCAGCDHFRTDVSHLPDLTAYLDDLLRTRERLQAGVDGVDEWARADATPAEQEITRVRHLISQIKGDIAALGDTEKTQIDEAVAVVRQHRAVHLGMPARRTPLPAPRPEALA
jgi:integrase